ncbi:MAG: GntR family transcriptional regulator [Oscillospiraceae bacterium]|jgi:GntR family transcriptional regulator|nr:GntR family transcriptional regulator [Oscillospiraceae bacterium]
MITLGFLNGKPIYEQLKEQIIQNIMIGVMKPNEQLPSVRVLAKQLGINPNTIQKAYQELEREKVIYSMVGKGSFVSDDTERFDLVKRETKNRIKKDFESAKSIGITLGEIRVIEQEVFQHNSGKNKDEVDL